MTDESIETLIRDMHGDMKVVKTQITTMSLFQSELSEHQRVANGRTMKLEIAAAEEQGARKITRYLLGVTLAMMTVGVGIAGVVLTLLAK